jgi:ketopantoate reductase
MKHERPTIGIIGLGPVGSILAAHLADNGEDVVVVDIIQELLLTIKERGLKISGFKDLTTRIEHTASSIDSLTKSTPEIVFISTKACVLQKILPAIRKIYLRY